MHKIARIMKRMAADNLFLLIVNPPIKWRICVSSILVYQKFQPTPWKQFSNSRVWGQAVLDFGVTDECDYAYTSVQFAGKIRLIEDLEEKRHGMEVLVRQVSLSPEEKLAKIKPEKLAKTTMGRIDITYMSGKKHQNPKPQA